MMKIDLVDAGKRFNREWIFRHVNLQFSTGQKYAITGPNGSGKSTLLQVIATATIISEGAIQYSNETDTIESGSIFKYISIAAPYLELIDEMTLNEFLKFHQKMKPFINGVEVKNIISCIGLKDASEKQIRYYSSGMKQRVKLAQAIFSDVPVILLDEPCTNLDKAGIELYLSLINDYANKRIVIVSSNDAQEYEFCNQVISMQDLKPS